MHLSPLRLYSIFHLNLAYSSIEEERRGEVIASCYWPLLALAKSQDLPFGIEACGYTLEAISTIDPSWIAELRRLTTEGRCVFIGSGYSQLIGPLVPAEVNGANLRLGNQLYEELLGFRPHLALVNEQAYSSGIVDHYLDAGYDGLVMEWNNPAKHHPRWNQEWRYLPQYARSADGRKIPLLWNNSISFQKFQHYAHGEKELDEYLEYLSSHQCPGLRNFPLYGNDVEIFDFRPGRYHTEADLGSDSEWQRIQRLFHALKGDGRFQLVSPVDALSTMDEPGAGNLLTLESAAIPVPVKKQEKYNITRWAVTGRDDLGINSACRRIHASLLLEKNLDDGAWRELCYLWSSDFRTHITERRWEEYRKRLKRGIDLYCCGGQGEQSTAVTTDLLPGDVTVIHRGRILTVETKGLRVDLNKRRGLALDGLWLKNGTTEKLCGTLPHGYYDDIALGADFYSGHLIFESPGKSKITDLEKSEPVVRWDPLSKSVEVSFELQTSLGTMTKRVRVFSEVNTVEYGYKLDWKSLPIGSLRLGHITLNPLAFDRSTLFFRSHNGGKKMETFTMEDTSVAHGEHTSFLVSAKHALGMTEGVLEIGDTAKLLRISLTGASPALLAMISFAPVRDSYFFRSSLSAREMDETSRETVLDAPLEITFSIDC